MIYKVHDDGDGGERGDEACMNKDTSPIPPQYCVHCLYH
jgi:hypothetical protein